MPTALSVNLNKVALLRNSRGRDVPDLLAAARTCLEAGADGITLHPRPDRRHALPEDVYRLADTLPEGVELNVEGNPFAGPGEGYPGFVEILRRARPHQATLVPDAPGQLTSDHGWDLEADGERLRPVIAELRGLDCRISLFVDADGEIERAAALGADRVELYTEPYARAWDEGEPAALLARFAEAARRARAAGLGVNAGHDLTLDNVGPFLQAVPHVAEVSIGHALIADALERGLRTAVEAYARAVAAA